MADTSAPAAASFAIVNTYSSGNPARVSSTIQLPYQASLFAMHQRLKETGALTLAQHVLVACRCSADISTHPSIRVVPLNCSDIDAAARGKGLNGPALYKMTAFGLAAYTRVLVLDLDTYVSGDVRGVFNLPAPAMVRWESAVAGPFQPNSGVMYVAPSRAQYALALEWLRRLPVGSEKKRKQLLYDMRTPWGAFNNRSAARAPDPGLVLAGDSDQHFFFMFWNVLERERFGPMHELPYEYNVKHYMLAKKQWSAAAYLTFMSRPEQGHIRIVHFNRDKPWDGAQCGPFQHAWWHAASRAVAEMGAAHAPTGLAAYVADGLRHEDARPCRLGARTQGVHVKMQHLEALPHTR
jgi:hypothetical protein